MRGAAGAPRTSEVGVVIKDDHDSRPWKTMAPNSDPQYYRESELKMFLVDGRPRIAKGDVVRVLDDKTGLKEDAVVVRGARHFAEKDKASFQAVLRDGAAGSIKK